MSLDFDMIALINREKNILHSIIENLSGHPFRIQRFCLSKITLVKLVPKKSSLSNPLLIRSMLILHHSYKEFWVIYEDHYIQSIDCFMVLLDASCRLAHVCLLSTLNITFTRSLAQIVMFCAYFHVYFIKSIRNRG